VCDKAFNQSNHLNFHLKVHGQLSSSNSHSHSGDAIEERGCGHVQECTSENHACAR